MFHCRLSTLLHACDNLLDSDDIQGRPCLWQEEPPHIHLDLFHSRIYICYGR